MYYEVDLSFPTSANLFGFAPGLGGNPELTRDYNLSDEGVFNGIPWTWSEVLPSGSDIYKSTLRSVVNNVNDPEFDIFVHPYNDNFFLEGDEDVRLRVIVPAIEFETSWETVTITEEYYDAKVQKDEVDSCSACQCFTCIDGNELTISMIDGSPSLSVADGIVVLSPDHQNGPNPAILVGLAFPANKSLPLTITVQLQVIKKQDDGQGNLIGLGRKLVDSNWSVSPAITFDLANGNILPGMIYWFSIEANLSAHVESWTLNSTNGPSNSPLKKS